MDIADAAAVASTVAVIASVLVFALRARELAKHARVAKHPLAVARAMRAEQRLYKRWSRLRSRGKDERTIVVAIARELAGFVWATATDQPLQQAT